MFYTMRLPVLRDNGAVEQLPWGYDAGTGVTTIRPENLPLAAKVCKKLLHFLRGEAGAVLKLANGDGYQHAGGAVVFRSLDENGLGDGEENGGRNAAGGLALQIEAENLHDGCGCGCGHLRACAADEQGVLKQIRKADDVIHGPDETAEPATRQAT